MKQKIRILIVTDSENVKNRLSNILSSYNQSMIDDNNIEQHNSFANFEDIPKNKSHNRDSDITNKDLVLFS